MITKISVHGLGKLGASMAAGFASRGFQVIGVDINPHAVTCLNEGRAPVLETDLEDLISAHREKIRASLDPDEAVANSEISFVIVPTPSDDRGAFTLQYARHAFKSLGQALRKKILTTLWS